MYQRTPACKSSSEVFDLHGASKYGQQHQRQKTMHEPAESSLPDVPLATDSCTCPLHDKAIRSKRHSRSLNKGRRANLSQIQLRHWQNICCQRGVFKGNARRPPLKKQNTSYTRRIAVSTDSRLENPRHTKRHSSPR